MKLRRRSAVEKRDFIIQRLLDTLKENIGPKGPVIRAAVSATVTFYETQYEAMLQNEANEANETRWRRFVKWLSSTD